MASAAVSLVLFVRERLKAPISLRAAVRDGRLKQWSNVVVAAGHGMLGMTQGPVTGKIVSDLLSGRDPGIDIQSISPNRF